MLRRLGVTAAAGAGLATVGPVLSAGPAAADHHPGFGHSNPVAAGTSVTGTLSDDIIFIQNLGSGDGVRGQASSGNGVQGWTNASRASGHAGVSGYNNADGDGVYGLGAGGNGVFGESYDNAASGVYGEGASGGGFGVAGRVSGATSTLGAGVFGEHEGLGNGIFGKSGANAHSGVWGDNTAGGMGVSGSSVSGFGLQGSSQSGIALGLGGTARLHQTLRAGAAPLTGDFLAGEQIRDAGGELWLCVLGGDPGTWRRAATVKEGFSGGSLNLLGKPIRLYDSRTTGGILAASATRNVQVTGVIVGGVQVPTGAKGVIGNVTVVGTGGTGYLTLFPQGSPPSPVTAGINWFAANQVLNNTALVRLNPANGQIGVGNGLGGGSTATHFVFDASGFVF